MLFLTNTPDKEQPSVTISSYITIGIQNERGFVFWLIDFFTVMYFPVSNNLNTNWEFLNPFYIDFENIPE